MADDLEARRIESKRRKVKDMEEANEASFIELRMKVGPGFTMDTSNTRREVLIQHLVEIGVMTEEQCIDFEIKFHGKVGDALNETWVKVREWEKEQRSKPIVVQRGKKLLGPDGREL